MSTTNENQFFIWEEKNSIELPKKLENNGESDECVITTSIKELRENVLSKDIMKTSGIYKIINKINGKYYVGSSDNIYKRYITHKNFLNNNNHINTILQNSWNKYGNTNFDFVIIEKVPKENLLITEQKYLNIAITERNKCYNICFDASSPMKGRKHDEKTKELMSIKRRLQIRPPCSQETKEKIKKSNSRTYEEIYGVEKSKEKTNRQSVMWKGQNNPMYNRHHTLEAKLKMSNCRIGKKHSTETKEKIGKYSMDNTKFSLKNTKTHEMFIGTKHEFIVKYNNGKRNYSIYCIFNKNKPYKGWILNT